MREKGREREDVGMFVLERNKRLPLDREKADVGLRKTQLG